MTLLLPTLTRYPQSMKSILVLWLIGCLAVCFTQISSLAQSASASARIVKMNISAGTWIQVSAPNCAQAPVESMLTAGTICLNASDELAQYQDENHSEVLSDASREEFLSKRAHLYSVLSLNQ